MRVLVCGGRDFADGRLVETILDRLDDAWAISMVIHGDAPGADTIADAWAASRGIPAMRFPADWDRHGRAAGPMRNEKMLGSGRPDLVVAFPGGHGTADMLQRAKGAHVPTVQVSDKGAVSGAGTTFLVTEKVRK